MDQLAREYASRPVVFIEQPVDSPIGRRFDRFWAAHGTGGTVYLPLIMVDSGHRFSSGPVDFYSVYRDMVEAELTRAPGAELECNVIRFENQLQFSGRLTNHSGVTLSSARNDATIHALVYEDTSEGSTGRIVRSAIFSPLTADLADGTSTTFSLATPVLSGVNWDNLHTIVLVDYRLGGSSGAYDMLQAVFPSQPAWDNTLHFSHMVVGGGWSTVLTLVNTGSDLSTGSLSFTGQDGKELPVTLDRSIAPQFKAAGAGAIRSIGNTFPVTLPAGGTEVFSTVSSVSNGPTKAGWARVGYTGGRLHGTATFQLSNGGILNTISGVFASQPTGFATIPVENDTSLGRFTGFAIANPTNEDINVSVVILNPDGSTSDSIRPPELNPLGPQKQVARFIHEYLPTRATFKGSVVLVAQGGKKFIVTALVQHKGLYTAIPVMPEKVSTVPD